MWTPKTRLGESVLNHQYTSLDQLLKLEVIKEPQIVDHLQKNLTIKVVNTDRVSHTLSSGKIYVFRVVALIGRNGLIGCGVGKSKVKINAIKKAVNMAKKNMVSLVELGETNFTPKEVYECKKGATVVRVTPLEGTSITSSKLGKEYCRLCGLVGLRIQVGNKKKDRKGKVGSAFNYYTALHECIKNLCGY